MPAQQLAIYDTSPILCSLLSSIKRFINLLIGGVTRQGLSSEVWCTDLGEENVVWTNLHSYGLPPTGNVKCVLQHIKPVVFIMLHV